MTRKWYVPVIAAAAAGLLAYGLTRTAVCDRGGPDTDRLHDVSFLVRTLGLNDAQATEIKRLNTTLGVTLDDCCMRHCAARARLGQALAAATNGAAQAEAILEDLCRAYEQSERATLNHIRAVRAVLDAEQRQRFDTMISACMCQTCSRQGGRCRTDAEGRQARGSPQDDRALQK